MSEAIVRIAARGDGVTSAGRHVPFAVPGDFLRDDGTLEHGPGHQMPPCRHFPECGGCQLQHVTDEAYADYCSSRIAGALGQHGLGCELRPAQLSPPRSRRRATLRAVRVQGSILIGFNAEGSNRVVAMRECHILRPELFRLIAPLRPLLERILPARRLAEVGLALTDQGPDILLKGVEVEGLEAVESLSAFCDAEGLARLSIDDGLGPEPRHEPDPVTVTLGGTPVAFPVGAFLQATEDGEAALVACVREAVDGAERIADLFSGLGTFALALDGEVMAAEASREAAGALRSAAAASRRSVEVAHRDLYRRPLAPDELARFGAVVLDPPRAGAEEQVKALAVSAPGRIAYVSCNPATFARDAKILVDGGYRLLWARPVGQFRWSTHVELAAAFAR